MYISLSVLACYVSLSLLTSISIIFHPCLSYILYTSLSPMTESNDMTSLLYHFPFHRITDEGISSPYRSGCRTFLVDLLGCSLLSFLSVPVPSSPFISQSSSSSVLTSVFGFGICLKCDTFRVIVCPVWLSAVTVLLVREMTTWGVWLKFGVGLLRLSCVFLASFLLPQHVVANFYCALSNISVAVGVTFVVSLPFTFFLTSFVMAVN